MEVWLAARRSGGVIDARQRRVGFLVAGCFFMEIMDGTIVSTAAPRLSEALRVPVSSIGPDFPVGWVSVLARTAKSDLMRMVSYIVWSALLASVIAPSRAASSPPT